MDWLLIVLKFIILKQHLFILFLFHFVVSFDHYAFIPFYLVAFIFLNTYLSRYCLPMEMFPCQYLNCLGVLLIHSSTIQISQFNLLLWALNFPLTSQAIFFYFNRLVCADISNGQENFPIPATNLVDNPPVPPSGTLQTFKEVSYPMLYRCCIFYYYLSYAIFACFLCLFLEVACFF